MLLFYIRHGEPIYEPDSLTALGKRQAYALSKRLCLYGIDEIYSSSAVRAIETARPTAELLHKEINVLDWCNEWHAWQELTLSDKDGRPCSWLYDDEEMRVKMVAPEVVALGKKWYEHEWFSKPSFKSGIERIYNETYRFLSRLGYEHDGNNNYYKAVTPNNKRIALFAHEGFGMAFLSAVLDVPYPVFCTHFGLGHSSMTVIDFGEGERVVPKVLQLANDSHIYRDGLPTEYNGKYRF